MVTPKEPTIAVEPLISTEYPKKSPAAETSLCVVHEGGFEHDVADRLAIKTHGSEPSTGFRSKNSTLPATEVLP